MFDLDHWREIGNALGSNKLRTFLTAFGVFWGIFMLMVMLGSGNGLENGVKRDLAGLATNSFFLWTRTTTKPYRGLPAGRAFEMNNDDIGAIREQIPEADVVAPRNQLGGFGDGNNVYREGKTGSFNIMGDYPEILQIQALPLKSGRFINRIDVDEERKVAVIGTRVVDMLFEPDEDPIGDHIRVNGVYFKVIGVFGSLRSGDDADRDVQTVHIPFTTFQRAFNYGDTVGWFAISSKKAIPASVVEKKAIALMAKRHRVAPDDARAFGHYNLEENFNETNSIFIGIRTLVWIVGIGTLLAGVIGVSNIMLVIVRERTHEIGIRRSVGATPFSIVSQIMLESTLLTAAAGYLGLVAGVGLMDLIAFVTRGLDSEFFANPGVDLASAGTALTILIVAGTLAGIMPARRAVAVSPVDALRGD